MASTDEPSPSGSQTSLVGVTEQQSLVCSIIPPMRNDSHKGQAGRIGILGGSADFTGAPFYSAMAALRLGADLAYVFCSSSAALAIKSYSPELMVTPVLDAPNALDRLQNDYLPRLHSLVIGPGLGRNEKLLDLLPGVLSKARELQLPVVIDADGLHFVNLMPEMVRGYQRAILTPNVPELERLHRAVLGCPPPEDRHAGVQNLAHALCNVTVIAKGMDDIISDDGSFHQKPWEEYLTARHNAFHLKKIYNAKATVNTDLPKRHQDCPSRMRPVTTIQMAPQTIQSAIVQFPPTQHQVSHRYDCEPSLVATKISLYLQALNTAQNMYLSPRSQENTGDAPSEKKQERRIFTPQYPQILAKSNVKSKIASMRWCYNGPRRSTSPPTESEEAKRNKSIATTQSVNPKRDEWLIDQAERAERRALGVACHTPSGDSAFNESVADGGHTLTVEERRYLKFLSNITEEILGLGIYSNSIIRKICQENIERNKGNLDKDILQELANDLLQEIGIDSTTVEDR